MVMVALAVNPVRVAPAANPVRAVLLKGARVALKKTAMVSERAARVKTKTGRLRRRKRKMVRMSE